VFVLGNPRYDTGNFEVEVVPFLSHRQSGEMCIRTIGSVDNWEELRDNFCYSFSPFECSELLRCEFYEFGQLEGESIGLAWLGSHTCWSLA
jgi:hypothetical protein